MLLFNNLFSSLQAERVRWVLWVPVALGVGVAAYFVLAAEPGWWVGASIALLGASLLWLARKGSWLPLALAVLLFGIGFTAAQWRVHRAYTPLLHAPLSFVAVEGKVADVEVQESGARLVIARPVIEKLSPEETPNNIRLTLRGSLAENLPQVGDTVALKAVLHPLPRPALPGAFDFSRYLYFDGLGAVGFATAKPEVVEKALAKSAFQEWLTRFRLKLAEDMRTRMPAPEGSIAAALTVGEMSAVPEEVKESMRDAGIYHVLSISGLHLALAAGLLFGSIRLLLACFPPLALRVPVKKIAAVLALISAFFYLLMAGSPVPAVRSFIMVGFVLLAILFDRQGISLYSLAWAAVLILLIAPDSMLGASFQMSFAATLAIISVYERYGASVFKPSRSVASRLCFYFIGIALTSLAATLATAPFVIYHFNRFQPWGLLTNMLVIPLSSFWIMPGAVIAFLLMPFGWEGIGYRIMQTGIDAMLACAEWAAKLPASSVSLPSLTDAGFIATVVGLLWFTLWKSRHRYAGVALWWAGCMTTLLHQTPDVLINDDAKQVMVQTEAGPMMLKGNGRSFDAESWLRAQGTEEVQKTPKSLVEDANTRVDCNELRCQYTRKGKTVLMIPDWKNAKAACVAPADMLIALFDVREEECKNASLVVDRARVTKEGAHALYVGAQGIRVETVAEYQGQRPWVP